MKAFLKSLFQRPLKRVDPSLVRLYRDYLFAYKGTLALACLFLAGAASMSSLTAMLLGKLTDAGFYQAERWVIFAAPAALIGVSLLFAVSTVMSSVLMAKVSQSVLVTIRTQLFESILHWPSSEYQKHSTGEISAKFVNEATVALSGATNSFIVLVRDCLQLAGLLAILFWHNWQLTLVTFLVAPGLAFILRTISRKMRVIVKNTQDTIGGMLSRIQETYGVERLVKVSNAYAFEEARFDRVNDRIRKLSLKAIKVQSLTTPLTQMLTMVAVAFVVGAALFEAQHGLLTFGEFITFLSALLLLRTPIQNLSGLNATFASIAVAARSIFDVLDAEYEKDDGKLTIEKAEGRVSFEHVSLRYPGSSKNALEDICLEINPGEHIVLAGHSGSGKSSLVNLLARFWELSQGRIMLDGQDIRSLSLNSLRRQISIVSQDIVLFDGSIRQNLLYENPDADELSLKEAIRKTALSEYIASLPQGLETKVGEDGKLLSGGQKQRIAIARAFLKDAPIIILDEATAALDSESEKIIAESIRQLTQGKTVITIAHRKSVAAYADRIIKLDSGKQICTMNRLDYAGTI